MLPEYRYEHSDWGAQRLERIDIAGDMWRRGCKISDIVSKLGAVHPSKVARYVIESLDPERVDWRLALDRYRDAKFRSDPDAQ